MLAQSCVPSVSRHWVPSCSMAQATIDGCFFKQVNPVPVKQELEEGDDKPFSSDKARYNKLNYKLKLVPQSMKNTWKVLRSQGKANPIAYTKFVDEVIDFVATDQARNKRIMSEEDKTISEQPWLSWHEAKQ